MKKSKKRALQKELAAVGEYRGNLVEGIRSLARERNALRARIAALELKPNGVGDGARFEAKLWERRDDGKGGDGLWPGDFVLVDKGPVARIVGPSSTIDPSGYRVEMQQDTKGAFRGDVGVEHILPSNRLEKTQWSDHVNLAWNGAPRDSHSPAVSALRAIVEQTATRALGSIECAGLENSLTRRNKVADEILKALLGQLND